ncbi:hypothetical protein M406DRAFT_225075, partial [Cryphonectria parasitica EP155]
MCFQLVELYAACRCPYYTHAVDRCSLYPNHNITQRIILVGYACTAHGQSRGSRQDRAYYDQQNYSDSGYASGHSHKSSHR